MRGRRVAAAATLLAVLATSGCSLGANMIALVGNNCATGSDAGISPEQNDNARIITNVALGLGLGQRGAEIGVVTAQTEAGLINVGFGDTMANGQMSSSRGLFQQLDAWGPLSDRLDPSRAATMFFTGGQAGQKGLKDIPGWRQMTIPQAAQAVEQSQFSDGSNYAKNETLGVRIVASILGGPSSCTKGNAVVASGASVTIPDNQYVVEALRGKVIQAPTAGMATGLAAGFSQLGLPYVWGGSNAAGGEADNGCSRGGGALNSCGSTVGFDCSGLTAYVLVKGGYPGPGTNSAAQRVSGQSVPWDQGLPGDIVGFDGHVAIYLGTIDGIRYILEASTVGVPIHVVKLTRTDYDQSLHRYWATGQ